MVYGLEHRHFFGSRHKRHRLSNTLHSGLIWIRDGQHGPETTQCMLYCLQGRYQNNVMTASRTSTSRGFRCWKLRGTAYITSVDTCPEVCVGVVLDQGHIAVQVRWIPPVLLQVAYSMQSAAPDF